VRNRRQEAYDERREQILRGALAVFSTKGFLQATNRDVAEAAGINSPGLIYHYFADKNALLRAVLERYAPPLQLAAHPEELMALPPEEGLTHFARAYMQLTENPQVAAFLRLVFGEAARSPEFAATFGEIAPFRVLRLLAGYLQRKMEEGLLRPVDPALTARLFAGPLVLQLLGRVLFDLPDQAQPDPAALVAANVSVFLRGDGAAGESPVST
jgi:AcrR family transcriptional regulator